MHIQSITWTKALGKTRAQNLTKFLQRKRTSQKSRSLLLPRLWLKTVFRKLGLAIEKGWRNWQRNSIGSRRVESLKQRRSLAQMLQDLPGPIAIIRALT